MTDFLVGYTGFVGSNLAKNHDFVGVFNSKNIADAYDKEPDLLVYAGLPAQKFFANEHPEEDLAIVQNAERNIKEIKPKKIILISTIDVIENPVGIDESTPLTPDNLQPYGYNRFLLEEWVKEHYENCLIVRLPALYGINLKKNFIYDMLNPIPKLIKSEKFSELLEKNRGLNEYYSDGNSGYYELTKEPTPELLSLLKGLNFTSLAFTDSRSKYQFYNLDELWGHLNLAMQNDIAVLHLANEPIEAKELYDFLYHENFTNELDKPPANYDYRTIYAELFGGENGYIHKKGQVLSDIKKFMGVNK